VHHPAHGPHHTAWHPAAEFLHHGGMNCRHSLLGKVGHLRSVLLQLGDDFWIVRSLHDDRTVCGGLDAGANLILVAGRWNGARRFRSEVPDRRQHRPASSCRRRES